MTTRRTYALAALLSSTAAVTAAGVVASCTDAESATPRGEPVPGQDASNDATHDATDTLPDAPEEPAPDGGPSPIISENPRSAYEGETQVAVAPDGTVGVAWIATAVGDTFASVAYRFSPHGGASWTPVRYV